MAQTTNRNIYYPDDYTEDADIPADMKEMAESVDAAIEEAVQETTYDDTELRGRILNAENDIDTLEGQVSILQGSMSAAETDIDDLETDLATAEEKISKLQNDVEDLRNNSLQVSDTGTNFKLSNTAKARFIELFIKGNIYQGENPSLENPQTIHRVTGNANIKIENKNIFGVSFQRGYWNTNGTYNEQSSTTTTMSTPKFTLKAGTYFVSNSKITNWQWYILKWSGNSWTATQKSTPSSFTLNEDALISFQFNGPKGNGVAVEPYLEELTEYMMLEYNSTATTYIAHQEQNLPLTLGNIELCKIDIAQDYFYKDSGKWYLHKETGKVVFDENSTFTKWNAASSSTRNAYRIPIDGIIPYTDSTKVIKVLTTKFKAVAQNSTWEIGDISGGTVYPRNVLFMVGVDVTASGMNTLVRGEPLYYVLETPTNTEITDATLISQLEALLTVMSYVDETNITATSSDLEPIITATAIRSLNDILTRLEVLESEV